MTGIALAPPHSDQLERAVIGAVLAFTDTWPIVGPTLVPADFFDQRHATIWAACQEAARRGANPDAQIIADALERADKLAMVGGYPYLARLASDVPTGVTAQDYAAQVQALTEKRRALLACSKIAKLCYNGATVADVLEAAQQIVTGARTGAEAPQSARQIADELWTDVCHWRDNPAQLRGLPTGLEPIDRVIGGLQPGRLTILFARPGHGKSALAFQIARHDARLGHRALLFSLEMTAKAVLHRLACAQAGLDTQTVVAGNISTDELSRISAALGAIGDEPILICTQPGMTAAAMLAETVRVHPALVVIDHVQLLGDRAQGRENEDQRVDRLFLSLRQMAIRGNCHVIAISQARKGIDERADKHPLMGDIPYGGERHADLILGLLRPVLYDQDADPAMAHVDVLKNRHGPAGARIELAFDGPHTRFARLVTITEEDHDDR